jgi:hypothetical protein
VAISKRPTNHQCRLDDPSIQQMEHRLALALLYMFASSTPVIQTGLCALVTVCALLMHVFAQPMRGTDSQAYQTVLLVCLLMVCMSKYFEASLLQVASPVTDTGSTDYAAVMTLMFGYVGPLVGVIVCYRRDIREVLAKLFAWCHKNSWCTRSHASSAEPSTQAQQMEMH